jgi:glycosyltransferase involved in cell wall biosynthesis
MTMMWTTRNGQQQSPDPCPHDDAFSRNKSRGFFIGAGFVLLMSLLQVKADWNTGQVAFRQGTQVAKTHPEQHSREWCGEWTPRGNTGNRKYTARKKAALSSTITSCLGSTSTTNSSTTNGVVVGSDYLPDRKVLHCQPPLHAHDRSPAILALDLQRLPRQQPEYSIVSPSHSAESVLQLTAPKLCQHTVGRWEIIFVLDASYDNSLQVLKRILLSKDCMQNAGLVRARILVQPTAVFETSSDNLGLTLADRPSHFYVEIQADMILERTGWNRDLARPLFAYNDIYSVSGRCGHGQGGGGGFVGRCGADVGQLSDRWDQDTRDTVIVTATNNRGPIIYRPEALRELGFFDEVNFVLGNDDHDMNRRAVFRGWYAAYKYTHFYAPLDLSPSRNKALVAAVPKKVKAEDKGYILFRQKKLPNSTCDPRAPRGFAPNNPRESIRRPLEPVPADADPNEPLPALPPLFFSNKTNARLRG